MDGAVLKTSKPDSMGVNLILNSRLTDFLNNQIEEF